MFFIKKKNFLELFSIIVKLIQFIYLKSLLDGYSMADIRYTWSKGKDSVGLSKGLELPQFKVVGHKQEQKEVVLSTGNYSRLICDIQVRIWIFLVHQDLL